MKDFKVIAKGSTFTGSHKIGTFSECEDYCKANNGKTGFYFEFITVPNV